MVSRKLTKIMGIFVKIGSVETWKVILVGVGHCFAWQGYSSLDGLMEVANIDSSYLS